MKPNYAVFNVKSAAKTNIDLHNVRLDIANIEFFLLHYKSDNNVRQGMIDKLYKLKREESRLNKKRGGVTV